MTRIIWKKIREEVRQSLFAASNSPSVPLTDVFRRLKLILPYLKVDLKYYDLGIEYRDAVRVLPSTQVYEPQIGVSLSLPNLHHCRRMIK